MWKLGQKQKLEKTQRARKTRECVYVLSAVYMTAENLLRIFPKESELKKNTNFTLAHDLTGLDRSSQSQSRMTEHSLFEPFPSSAIFSVLFSFFFFSLFIDEDPGQIQDDLLVSQSLLVSFRQVANTRLGSFSFLFLQCWAVKSHKRDFLLWLLEDEKRSHAWLLY